MIIENSNSYAILESILFISFIHFINDFFRQQTLLFKQLACFLQLLLVSVMRVAHGFDRLVVQRKAEADALMEGILRFISRVNINIFLNENSAYL